MCSLDLYTVGFPKEEGGNDMFQNTKVLQTWIQFLDKRLSLPNCEITATASSYSQ